MAVMKENEVMRLSHRLWTAPVAIALLLLTSCNGSSSGSASGSGVPGFYTSTPSPLTGAYNGVQCAGSNCFVNGFYNNFSFSGAIAPNGTGYFGIACFVVVIPGLTSAGSIQTSEIFIATDPSTPDCSTLSWGPQFVSDAEQLFGASSEPFSTPISISTSGPPSYLVSGNATQGQNLSLSPPPVNQLGLSFPPVNVLQSPGIYQGSYWYGNTAVSLTLQADGTLSGHDALGCHIAGSLVPTQSYTTPSFGQYEFQVSADVTGPAVCAAGGVYGVALGNNNLHGGTTLFIVATNADNTRAFAVTTQSQ